MRPRIYSAFWLAWAAGLICLGDGWAERDESTRPEHPLEGLDMRAWLRLGEHERGQAVREYAGTNPPIRFTSTGERQRQTGTMDLSQRLDACRVERDTRNQRRQAYVPAS